MTPINTKHAARVRRAPGPAASASRPIYRRRVPALRIVMVLGLLLAGVAGSLPAAASTPTTVRPTTTTTTTTPPPPAWQTAWTSPIDYFIPGANGLAVNATARDIAQVAVAGTAVELTLSNLWSGTPTTFGSVTVGVGQGGAAIVPGSIVPVTFNGGSRSVTIAAQGTATSDPVAMTVQAGETLSVSMSVIGSSTVSVHYCCAGRIDSFSTLNNVGDRTTDPTGAAFSPSLASTNMRWLSAIAVSGTQARGTVVAFGDSITEGYGFPTNGVGWPGLLQTRIAQLPPDQQVAAVNEGISGNTLTTFPPGASYAEASGGLPGVTRLDADGLALAGVTDLVLFLGTNDIWFGGGGVVGRPIPPYGTATAIETGMEGVINATHAKGIKIFGVTLLPRSSSNGYAGEKPEVWTPADQATLSAVNAWMLTPGTGFDGVIDLAAVMGDVYNGACQPNLPYPPYFTGDNLHPTVAGQTAMADAIPTTLFGIPQAPQVPELVTATPTPGCPGAVQAANVLALARQPATPTPTTTTTPPTTTPPTTRPAHHDPARRGPGVLTVALLIAVGVLVLLVAGALVLRRRALRRRRARRRALAIRLGPVGPSPPARPPPPSVDQGVTSDLRR